MAGPGAHIVDRVGVLVIPDTSKFLPDLRKYLARVEKQLEVAIRVVADTNGLAQEVRRAAGEATTGVKASIPATVDTDRLRQEVSSAAKAAESAVNIQVPLDAGDQAGLLQSVRSAASAAEKATNVKVPISSGSAADLLHGVSAAAEQAERASKVEVPLDVDDLGFAAKVRADVDRAARGIEARIPATLEGERARRELAATVQRLKAQAARMEVSVPLDLGEAAAMRAELRGEVAMLQAQARTNPVEIPVRVDSNTLSNALRVDTSGLSRIGSDASGSRSAVVGLVGALAGIVPALVPIAGVAAGAFGGIAFGALSAVAGAGAVAFALGGVVDAVKQTIKAEDQGAAASTSSANSRAAAADAIANAQAGLADAEASAASASVRAARAVSDAQRGVVDARRSAARASEQAAEAVANAEERLADVRRSAARAAEQAARAIANAERALADVRVNAARRAEQAARAVSDAERGVSDAQRAAADAVRALADARRSAADATQAATERITSAIERLNSAQDRERRAAEATADAQKDLTAAREDARRSLEDLTDRVEDGALREERALLNVQRAQRRFLDSSMRNPLDFRDAQLSLREAEDALDDVRRENKRLAADKVAADKAGVDGSKRVTDAQKRVADAIRAQGEALRETADARREIVRAEENAAKVATDNARKIADAQRGVKDANRAVTDSVRDLTDARADQARSIRDSARDIADAEQAVTDARKAGARQAVDSARDITKAQRALAKAQRDQGRVAQDNARDIADAQRRVGEALEAQKETARQSASSIASAQRALAAAYRQQEEAASGAGGAAGAAADAMADLSREARKFAKYLLSLRPALKRLRDEAAKGFLPGLMAGMQAAGKNLQPLREALPEIAKAMGDVAEAAGKALGDKVWQDFFKLFGKKAPDDIRAFGRIMGDVTAGFAGLYIAFRPIVDMIIDGTEDMAQGFRDWATDKDGSLAKFVGWFKKNGPAISSSLGSIVRGVGNLILAFAPIGEKVLPILASVADWFSDLDPKAQTAIATVLALIGPFMAVASVAGFLGSAVGAIGTALSVLGWPVMLAIGVVALLAGAFALLYAKSESVRTAVSAIGTALSEAWATIQPILTELWDQVKADPEIAATWQHVQETAVRVLDLIKQAIEGFIVTVKYIWSRWGEDIKTYSRNAFSGALTIIQGLLTAIDGVIDAFVALTKGDFSGLMSGIGKIVSGGTRVVVGLFQNLGSLAYLGAKVGMDLMVGMFLTVNRKAVSAFVGLPGKIGGLIKSAFTGHGHLAASAGLTIGMSFVRAATAPLVTLGSLIWSQVTGAINLAKALLSGSLDGLGKWIVEGIVWGLRWSGGKVGSVIVDICSKAIASAKRTLGIASPSKVFKEIGAYTGEGFVLGLESMQSSTHRAMSRMLAVPDATLFAGSSIPVSVQPASLPTQRIEAPEGRTLTDFDVEALADAMSARPMYPSARAWVREHEAATRRAW